MIRQTWYPNLARVQRFVSLLAVDRAYGRGLDKQAWDVRRHRDEVVSEDLCINEESEL